MGRRCIRRNISVPLIYEKTSLPASQVNRFRFPWFCGKTEAQFGIRNTYSDVGKFLFAFAFDDGTNRVTVNVPDLTQVRPDLLVQVSAGALGLGEVEPIIWLFRTFGEILEG